MSPVARRDFLSATGRMAAGALALPFGVPDAAALDAWLASADGAFLNDPRPSDDLAQDEPYWARVRSAYDLHPDVLNLDHGWTNPTPRAAVDELVRGARALEALPAEQLPKVW